MGVSQFKNIKLKKKKKKKPRFNSCLHQREKESNAGNS